jgi:hypothetical protein
MVTKLFNYNYNIYAFVYALTLDLGANLGLEIDDGKDVKSSTTW